MSACDPAAFEFELPAAQIAQHPTPRREDARLLILDRKRDALHHGHIRDLPRWLATGDLLVVNATQVVPARLVGHKVSGGQAEALLLEHEAPGRWRALLRCSGRIRPGLRFCFGPRDSDAEAEILAVAADGSVTFRFPETASPYQWGEIPLPRYIRDGHARPEDRLRYQTVFARVPGSVAAPTAGLHLSDALLTALADSGVDRAEVVLHIGPGTFRPPRESELRSGRLHAERFELPRAACEAVNRTRAAGHRVVAVGTTTTRVLESSADAQGHVAPRAGSTDLFLRPGSRFRAIDALITNFHLPRSNACSRPTAKRYSAAIAFTLMATRCWCSRPCGPRDLGLRWRHTTARRGAGA